MSTKQSTKRKQISMILKSTNQKTIEISCLLDATFGNLHDRGSQSASYFLCQSK